MPASAGIWEKATSWGRKTGEEDPWDPQEVGTGMAAKVLCHRAGAETGDWNWGNSERTLLWAAYLVSWQAWPVG